jgi:2-keto-myo-inositol isomerase
MLLAYHGGTSGKCDLSTDLAVTTKAGYQALELWAAKIESYLTDHSPGDLRRLLVENHVLPTAINSIEFIGFRGAAYPQIRERCRRLCEIAEAIDCPTLVLVPSPTPQATADSVLELFFPWDKVVEEYVTVLRDLAAIAQPHGVNLAFEFLGFAWCSVRTPRGAYEIIQKTDRANVGINFDACHFFGGGGQLDEIDGLDPARICTFHINDMEDIPKEAITDSRRLLPGRGIIPLNEICRRLKRIGYDGLCAVEVFRPEYWGWDPYRLAVEARTASLEILSPHFAVR